MRLRIVEIAGPWTYWAVFFSGMYLGIVTVLAAVGILLTILLLMVYNTEGDVTQSKSVSEGCILHFLRFAACFICSSKRRVIKYALRRRGKSSRVAPKKGNQSANRNDPSAVTDSVDEEADMTWKEVAIVLDRFTFVVFLAVTIVMNIGCLVGLTVGADQTKLWWRYRNDIMCASENIYLSFYKALTLTGKLTSFQMPDIMFWFKWSENWIQQFGTICVCLTHNTFVIVN